MNEKIYNVLKTTDHEEIICQFAKFGEILDIILHPMAEEFITATIPNSGPIDVSLDFLTTRTVGVSYIDANTDDVSKACDIPLDYFLSDNPASYLEALQENKERQERYKQYLKLKEEFENENT